MQRCVQAGARAFKPFATLASSVIHRQAVRNKGKNIPHKCVPSGRQWALQKTESMLWHYWKTLNLWTSWSAQHMTGVYNVRPLLISGPEVFVVCFYLELYWPHLDYFFYILLCVKLIWYNVCYCCITVPHCRLLILYWLSTQAPTTRPTAAKPTANVNLNSAHSNSICYKWSISRDWSLAQSLMWPFLHYTTMFNSNNSTFFHSIFWDYGMSYV